MKKLGRLLLVSFIAENEWTGMGRWTFRMSEALTRGGYHVESWWDHDFPISKKAGRWAVLIFPIALAVRLWRNREQFDAVLVHEPGGVWYGMLRQLFHSTLPPMIAVCHNVESRHFGEMVRYHSLGLADVPRKSRLLAPLFRFWQTNGTIRLADHVVCLSTVDADYIATQLNVPRENITQIANGAPDPATFPNVTRKEHSVLCVAGWLDVKGSQVLPRLWRAVRCETPQAKLTLVGAGRLADDILPSFAVEDRDSITVIPRIEDQDELWRMYREHTVFLLPSLSEGSPLSLLEAMAAGTPSVATAVGGVPDLMEDGSHGFLFNPEDAAAGATGVTKILADTQFAGEVSKRCIERARELTWDRAAGQLARAIAAVTTRTTVS